MYTDIYDTQYTIHVRHGRPFSNDKSLHEVITLKYQYTLRLISNRK